MSNPNTIVFHPAETYEDYKKVVNFLIENKINEEQIAIIAKMLLAHYA